ncbi:EAP30/Vps36 family-domain-containing protein [Lipomyces oligophaga]|uniref:EAP30/Vps36 family-domain-containing protein n=1 Tax=Lipomyces oligophaga TaxID=45792 RepID=UPI0034CEB8FB
MRFWQPLDLTPGHRPALYDDETDVLVQNGCGIYEGRVRLEGYQNGRLYLTSHRICYVDIVAPLLNSVSINLPDLKTAQYTAGFLKSSPKITLYFADSFESDSNTSSASATPNGSSASLPLSGVQSPRTPSQSQINTISWICPICSFSNKLTTNYRPDISSIPACVTCGVRPPGSIINEALADSMSETPSLTTETSETNQEQGKTCPKCTFLNDPMMRYCELCNARLSSSTFNPSDYILDKTQVRKESYLPFSIAGLKDGTRSKYTPTFAEEVPTYVKLSFRVGGDKEFFEKLRSVVTEKTWLKNMARAKQESSVTIIGKQSSEPESKPSAMPSYGIHGLQQINEDERQKNKNLMTSLNDLQSLMTKAKGLAALAESLASRLATSPGVPDEARNALRESSNALSLSSPIVTREMAGSGNDVLYYAELARQLAEYLQSGILKNEGGIITLFDLFAIYNKARGISLISPKDLQNACNMFERLKLPFRTRQFKSGLLVIEEASRNDDLATQLLVEYIRDSQTRHGEEDGVTPEEISQKLGWNVSVCVEEIENAQEQGLLVSDAIVSGTRYFTNMFSNFQWDWKQSVFGDRPMELSLPTFDSDGSLTSKMNTLDMTFKSKDDVGTAILRNLTSSA